MASPEQFELLRASLRVLEGAASFCIGKSRQAVKARNEFGKTGNYYAILLANLASTSALLGQAEDPRGGGGSDHEPDVIVLETLEAIESLIHDAEGEGDAARSFPGLQFLHAQHVQDACYVRQHGLPKPLAHRKYLLRASRVDLDRLQEQLGRCRDAAGRTTRRDDSVLADIADIQEWRITPDGTAHAQRLTGLLQQYGTACLCRNRHRPVKIAFGQQAVYSGHTISFSDAYQLCFPDTETPLWHCAQLEFHEDELATRENVSGSTRTHFAEAECYDEHNSLCAAFTGTHRPRLLSIDETMLKAYSSHTKMKGIGLVSLRDTLAMGARVNLQDISRRERIKLAVALAYQYLYLSATSWWPDQETAPELYLTASSDQIRGLQPFIELRSNSTRELRSSIEYMINARRPSLPALGLLLLQIWHGECIEEPLAIARALEECRSSETGDYWHCAIDACLNDPLLKAGTIGTLRENAALRAVYVLKVIKSLQWLLENCCHASVASVFSAGEVSRDTDHEAIGIPKETTSGFVRRGQQHAQAGRGAPNTAVIDLSSSQPAIFANQEHDHSYSTMEKNGSGPQHNGPHYGVQYHFYGYPKQGNGGR